MAMNCVHMLGRLTKDPVIDYKENGTVVAQFILAVERPISKAKLQEGEDRQTVEFIPCVAFNKLAEQLGNNVSKGMRLLVHNGRLCINQYKDQQGNNRYHTEVMIYAYDYVEHKA